MQFHPRFPQERMEFSETATRHGIDNTIPEDLLQNAANLSFFLADLEVILMSKGLPAHTNLTSGYRCPKLNKKLGGSSTSAHMSACAADITIHGIKPYDLAILVKSDVIDRIDQVILEFGQWVHVAIPPIGRAPKRSVLTAKRQLVDGKSKVVYFQGIVR